MRDGVARDKAQLQFRQTETVENENFSRFAVLSETVFGVKPEPAWPAMLFVDAAGCCVAGLQHRLLTLCGDGTPFQVGAIRNVAVAPEWRGQGLMQDLLTCALPWCDARAAATLLYAETPSLYARHGFVPVPQHAFEGIAPRPAGPPTAQPLDARTATARIGGLLATRAPTSSRLGILDDGGMAEHKLRDGTWPLAYDPASEALIVYEFEGETLAIVDVIAQRIPTAARIVGALDARPRRLRTLFPPDRLAWDGLPMVDDAGLMARGTLPAAMARPFILPPTFEF